MLTLLYKFSMRLTDVNTTIKCFDEADNVSSTIQMFDEAN